MAAIVEASPQVLPPLDPELAVLVRDDSGKVRRFVMTYVKRYEPDGLSACLEEIGWRPIAIYDQDDLLCLFERA